MPTAAPRRRLASLRAHLCPAAAAPPLPSWYDEAEPYEDTLDAVAMDSTAYAANRLTAAQREQFDKDGYLCARHPPHPTTPSHHPTSPPRPPCRGRIILDALPADEFAAVSKALDDLRELRESQGLPPNKSVLDPVYSASHSLWQEPAVVRMLKAPKVLPKVRARSPFAPRAHPPARWTTIGCW